MRRIFAGDTRPPMLVSFFAAADHTPGPIPTYSVVLLRILYTAPICSMDGATAPLLVLGLLETALEPAAIGALWRVGLHERQIHGEAGGILLPTRRRGIEFMARWGAARRWLSQRGLGSRRLSFPLEAEQVMFNWAGGYCRRFSEVWAARAEGNLTLVERN